MSDIALADGKPLTDTDIHYAAREELQYVMGPGSGLTELETNQKDAYEYYKNEPREEDTEGLSKLQTTDVSDAIEWILPTIVKSFVETPDVVRFEPDSPEDEEQADLESDYTHHAFMKKSNGFLVLYETIKDALLLKNGVTYTCWDETIKTKVESYSELLDSELEALLYPTDGAQVRVEQQTTREIPATDPQTLQPLFDPTTGEPIFVPVHDIKLRRYTTNGQPKVLCCVPEQFYVRRDHGSIDLKHARFSVYWMEKSKAELVAARYDPDLVDEVPLTSRNDVNRGSMVRVAREDVENTFNYPITAHAQAHVDRSQDMVAVNYCFMTLDINGDGIEEYVMVVLGGDNGDILLDWYEVEDNPFDAASPFIASHKFYGYSVFDKLREIQDAGTKFLRMISDNIDLMNDPEKKYIPGMVNMEDVMVRQVGGHKRVEDMGAYEELPPPPVNQHAFQMLDYLERWRANRVGVDPNAQSVTRTFPDESMNTAFERLMSAKEEVVALIIRSIAEVWFAPMMVKLRRLIMQNQNRAETVRMGSKWINIDPRNWVERNSTTVTVGLGTGDRIKKIAGARELIQYQTNAMGAGKEGYLVTDSKLHNALSTFTRYAGLGDPDDFWLDPVKTEREIQIAMQTQQAPSADAAEAFAARLKQQQMQEAMTRAQGAQQGAQGAVDPQTAMAVEQLKAQVKLQSDQLKAQSDALKLEQDRMKIIQNQMQFLAKERREWAALSAESAENVASLALEAEKAQQEAQKDAQQAVGGDQ